MTRKEFKFASKHNLPFFFVSAADGTNIVKVRHALTIARMLSDHIQLFQTAISEAQQFKASGGDALSEVLDLLADRKVGIPYCISLSISR